MASGSINLDHTNSYFCGRIDWYSTPNTSSNTSSVYAQLFIWKQDGATTSGTFKGSFTIGSKTINISTYLQLMDETCIAEDTVTIYHNNDGSGSCYLNAEIKGPSGTTLSGHSVSGEATAQLDKIPRASIISAASSVYLGNVCSVTWKPLASSFYFKLKFSMGGWSYTTGAIGPNTTSSYSYTGYTIPLSVASQIPNATSGKMTATLYTYSSSSCSSGTQIGSSSSATFTVTLPDSVVPTIDSCAVSVDNSANSVVAGWGIAIAGFSKVNVSATASGIYGSTINSFNITGSYVISVTGSSLNYTGGIISSSGNKQFMVTCTDSRGRTSTVYTSDIIAFTSYTAPKVNKLTMSKDTRNDDNVSNDRMVATATWEYDAVGGKNSATAKIYYKTTSATDWTTHSGTLSNGVAFTLENLVPDELLSYNFKVVVTDALGNSAEKDAFSSTITVLLDFKAGGDGLGIGKICENPGLEVSMDATFYNEVYIRDQTLEEYIKSHQNQPCTDTYILDIVYPVGAIYLSAANRSPASLFGGTWTQLKDRFLLAAGSTYTAGDIGGSATHTLTVNEMPSHQHYGVRRANSSLSGTGSTGASNGDGSASYYTDSAGGNQPHNNMPPYLVVYMWQRTA